MLELVVFLFVFLIAMVLSMMGLGGALLYLPLFYWLGIDVKSAAIPTALFLNMVTSSSAAATYLGRRMVDLRAATPLFAASLAGAPFGAYLLGFLDVPVLLLAFGLIQIRIGLHLLSGRELGNLPRGRLFVFLGTGFFAGFLGGLFGLGGGTYLVIALIALGFDPKIAAATSLVCVFFISLMGLASHFALGRVALDPAFLFYTSIAALLGAQVGSRLLFQRIPGQILKKGLGLLLLTIAGRILYGALTQIK